MASLEYKQAVLKLSYEGEITAEGKMKVKTKTYRNIQSAASVAGLETVSQTLSSFSSHPYIGAEKVQTSSLI